MAIKIVLVLLVCSGIFDSTRSAPTTSFKDKQEDKPHKKSVFEYDLQVKLENGQFLQEKLKIDTNAKTEYISVPKHSGQEEIEVMQDFSKNLTVIHVKPRNVCYISKLISATSPDVLKTTIDNKNIPENNSLVLNDTTTWKIDMVFAQRSLLSEEMAIMCARSSIYWIQKIDRTGSRQSRDTEHSRARRSPCSSSRYCWYENIYILVKRNGKRIVVIRKIKKCKKLVSC